MRRSMQVFVIFTVLSLNVQQCATFPSFSLPSGIRNQTFSAGSIVNKIRGGNINVNRSPTNPPQPEPTKFTETSQLHKFHGMMFSGQLLPNLRHLFAGSSESYNRGFRAVKQFYKHGDVITLFLLSTLPLPIMRIVHKLYYQVALKVVKNKKYKEYEDSKISKAGTFLAQGGRIASVVYMVELFTTFALNVMAGNYANVQAKKVASAPPSIPKNLIPLQKFPGLFANFAYGYWIAKQVSKVKTHLLKKFYSRLPDPETYDQLFDFLIYITAAILVLDASEFDLQGLVRSLVAVGGLSSIVVGLALKDPVSQLLQGALMMASNKFHRNEQIRLGDGTQGKVVDIGLLETTIMGGDDIMVKIPHSKLAGQKFSNISRMARSQTKFELRFHLHDMPRIQDILKTIKEEIRVTCPRVITDGSRPFRVLWTDIATDHIVVTVDAHHQIPPACNAYWENRELVLSAISTGARKAKAKFAMPVTLQGPFSSFKNE